MPTPSFVRPSPRPTLAIALALATTSTWADTTRVDSMRCSRGLVSEGDSKVDLLGRCGEPALHEERFEERRERASGPANPKRRHSTWTARGTTLERRSLVRVELWTYDFGPQRFVHFVTLEDGTVVRIERGAYGLEHPAPTSGVDVPRARCEPQALGPNLLAAEVVARCGPPASVDRRFEALDLDGAATQSTTIETWVYDFGPATFTRRLTFRDGVLRSVASGAYGYSR